jgi:hypothetical protein
MPFLSVLDVRNTLVSFANLLSGTACRWRARQMKTPGLYRPRLEMLEDRTLLSVFTVDHLADDMVGSGLNGSLRYSIINAADGDDIQFAVTGTINLGGALPNLTHRVSIQGPGANLLTVRRDTGGFFRIFTVPSGTTVGIAGLTIANGYVYGDYVEADGGGIWNGGSLTLSNCTVRASSAYGDDGAYGIGHGYGGGIYNTGTLTISNCAVSGNSATGYGAAEGDGGGGGIYNTGTLTISESTLSGNSASGQVDSYYGVSAAGSGGGIYNVGTLTVSDSTFSGNSASGYGDFGGGGHGGGIYNYHSRLTVSGCTFSGNSADGLGYGGGIFNYNATLTVSESTFSGNSAHGYIGSGGAIYNDGTLTVSGSTFSGNTATYVYPQPGRGSGGGICNGNYGTLTVSVSTFSGNSASSDNESGYGGGIYNHGMLTVSDSTFSGNSAHGYISGGSAANYGGGIANYGGTLTVTNSTISGNSAYGDFGGNYGSGGGIYTLGSLTLTNATVSGNNSSGGSGGGICHDGGTFHTRNSIIAGNTALSAPDLSGNVASQGYNLFGNDSGGSGFDATDLRNVNAMLGPLQDNGGPTMTHALLAGSPALNAGDPAQLGVADQRGVVRAGGVNIGAYQASASVLVLTGLPDSAAAGATLSFILTARDEFGQTAFGYTGTVHFSSSDDQAALPDDYVFTAGDGGMHTFADGLTFYQTGTQRLTATDTVMSSLTGGFDVLVL